MDTSPNPTSAHVYPLNVYLIFTASGAAALVYQVLWARWLSLVFGNTTTSVSIVLSSFMLGLALGSYLAGRWLPRIANPMLVYAYLELGIGLFALSFPWLSQLTDWVFIAIVNADSPLILTLLVRTVLALALLVVPTTLMGATLPLLTDFFRRDPHLTRSWKVGLLYATNTLGAALGTMVASFFLIELLGVRSTTLLAAALNFVVAYVGFNYSRARPLEVPTNRFDNFSKVVKSHPHSDAIAAGDSICPPSLNNLGKLALWVLATSGAIALASEVLWTRALEILIGNSSYAFATIVVLYLLGIAAGSWVMSLLVKRLKALPLWLATLQLGMGIWTVVAIFLFNLVSTQLYHYVLTSISIELIVWNYLQAASILLPLACLSGAMFPVATRILDPQSQDAQGVLIARAYSWNTLGAVFGSFFAGFGIAVWFDYFQAIYLLAVFYGLTAVVTVMISKQMLSLQAIASVGTRLYAPLLLTLSSFVLIGLGLFHSFEESRFVTRINTANTLWEVVYHQPGLQGITTVLKKRDQPLKDTLLVNGRGMTVKVTDTKMMAHLPLLLHPSPDKTLVICFGMGTTYRSAISHGGQVTVVELVKEVFEAFDHFFADAAKIRAFPKGQMVTNDGRNFLKLTQEHFDVITIDPPPPIDAAGVNHLYSKEFLELARDHLTPGGIMAHWIPLPKTIGGGVDDLTTFNMLLHTFATVYPHTVVLTGWHKVGIHVLGSLQPITVSKERLQQRLAVETIARDINEWDHVPIDYYLQVTPLDSSAWQELPLVTDDHPLLEFNLLRLWRAGTQKVYPPIAW
jgi:spermidine synthase